MRELYAYQQTAMDRLRLSLSVKKTRPVLMAPTGYGKGVLAAKIVENALAKGRRVWITVPRIDLIDQFVRLLWEEGIRGVVGVMQASHQLTDYSQPVQVVSVKTLLGLNLDKLRRPDLILVDECHEQFVVIKSIIENWLEVPVIGLSATPWSNGLGRWFNDLIISATTADLIRIGRLCKFRVFAPTHPDLTGVKTGSTTHGPDYVESQLSEAMQRGSITADVVSTWLQRGKGRPTLVFAVDRAHAMALHKQFLAADVRVAYQDGTTPKWRREEIRKGFASGEFEVVCNIATLTVGIDWPMIGCIVLARPTKSEMLLIQIIGRGLRTHHSKDELLILDHSDSILRLGFPDEIHHTKLHDGTPKKAAEKKPSLPRECSNPRCSALLPKFAKKCLECGFEPTPQARDVEVQDGELSELTRNKENRQAPWAEKIAWAASLKAYAIAHNYKPGWWAQKYKDKYGVWPNDSRVRNVVAADEVQPFVRSWITASNIRWAKRKERRA
ncbi:MAG TPA: DEAD/DEAH box helicase [Candidatus Dormibacteraeota bacterium]|jgi:superfamily II DNA or RNA helicase